MILSKYLKIWWNASAYSKLSVRFFLLFSNSSVLLMWCNNTAALILQLTLVIDALWLQLLQNNGADKYENSLKNQEDIFDDALAFHHTIKVMTTWWNAKTFPQISARSRELFSYSLVSLFCSNQPSAHHQITGSLQPSRQPTLHQYPNQANTPPSPHTHINT